MNVLLSPEDELFLALTLGLVFPDRHRDGHHDGRNAHRDQQRRHRVTALVGAPIALTT